MSNTSNKNNIYLYINKETKKNKKKYTTLYVRTVKISNRQNHGNRDKIDTSNIQ